MYFDVPELKRRDSHMPFIVRDNFDEVSSLCDSPYWRTVWTGNDKHMNFTESAEPGYVLVRAVVWQGYGVATAAIERAHMDGAIHFDVIRKRSPPAITFAFALLACWHYGRARSAAAKRLEKVNLKVRK